MYVYVCARRRRARETTSLDDRSSTTKSPRVIIHKRHKRSVSKRARFLYPTFVNARADPFTFDFVRVRYVGTKYPAFRENTPTLFLLSSPPSFLFYRVAFFPSTHFSSLSLFSLSLFSLSPSFFILLY